MHALTIVGALTADLAETILRREFLDELFANTNPTWHIALKQQIGQINSAAQLDLVDYRGPQLDANDTRFKTDADMLVSDYIWIAVFMIDYIIERCDQV